MSWPPPIFHVMIKPHGALCNLNCSYCFYLAKEELYPESDFRMDDATLENFIQQYIAAQQMSPITFSWQGGEPTAMGLDFFRKVIALEQKYTTPKITIENTLQTNGTLLTEDWARFLYENHFLVGISIDGPANLHDPYRRDKGGNPSHKSSYPWLEFIAKISCRDQYSLLRSSIECHSPVGSISIFPR